MKTFLLLAVLLAFSMLQCRADEPTRSVNFVIIPLEFRSGSIILMMDPEGLWIHMNGQQKKFCDWNQLKDYQKEVAPVPNDGSQPGALYQELENAG